MRKKGAKGAPTDQAFKQAAKTAKRKKKLWQLAEQQHLI
jgi:hypothetical protein